MTTLDANPFELRQVQCLDGLYVHAADIAKLLRARAGQFGELADSSDGVVQRTAYREVANAFTRTADQLDVAAIGCVTAEPAPWVAAPNRTKEN